jgi:hypothetical protein
MPDRDNPHGLPADSVEEPVRADDYLAVGKVRKLWQPAARVRKVLQAAQATLGPLTEADSRTGVLAANELKCIEELDASRGREADPHALRLLKEPVGLSKDGIEAGALARLDLALAACQSPEDLELLFELFVGIDAEKHGRSAATLGDDNRLARTAQALENSSGVLPEVRNRYDLGNLCHRVSSKYL